VSTATCVCSSRRGSGRAPCSLAVPDVRRARARARDVEGPREAFVNGRPRRTPTRSSAGVPGHQSASLNRVPLAQLVGIKKFCKGFFRGEDGRVMGYNSPVAQNVLDGRWRIAPKKFGFYEVCPGRCDGARQRVPARGALGLRPRRNKRLDPTAGLRDYVVQLGEDLFLGKAYYAVVRRGSAG